MSRRRRTREQVSASHRARRSTRSPFSLPSTGSVAAGSSVCFTCDRTRVGSALRAAERDRAWCGEDLDHLEQRVRMCDDALGDLYILYGRPI